MITAKQLAISAVERLPEDCTWVDIAQALEFLAPWQRVDLLTGPTGIFFETELRREVPKGHALWGLEVLAIAHTCSDDVLYQVGTPLNKFAVVHLTWATETNPQFPHVELFDSLHQFRTQRMLSDAADSAGGFLEEDYKQYRKLD